MPSHTDAMIADLEKEIEERSAFIEGTTANAQDEGRDLTESELELITGAQKRIEAVEERLGILSNAQGASRKARERADEYQKALTKMRYEVDKGEVEYRSAGDWAFDMWRATALSDREARERLEVATRAADHVKTGDVPGVVPTPITGELLNFVDDARPLTVALGIRPLTRATWYRPHVTQNTAIAVQGAAGAAADEKAEFTSQKMTIERIQGDAVTYGGYVNVSRQTLDFSEGFGLDGIISDLASQFSIETEQALGTEITATATTAVGYGASPTADTVRAAIWAAVGDIYAAMPGAGQLILAVSPGALEVFGPLFTPISTNVGPGEGLTAGDYRSGAIGAISGIPAFMSPGLPAGEAFVLSRRAIEVYEQRVGALQVTEPSVGGVQVGYMGYFTALTIDDGGIVPLTAT